MRYAGHVARIWEMRNAFRLGVGTPEGRRRRWVDNIKMDLLETGWGAVDKVGLYQNRDQGRAFVNTVMIIWLSLGLSRVQNGEHKGDVLCFL
jgi:hypothetical protein